MIYLRDAKILFSAISMMEGTNICNMRDGDLVRRIDIFNLLNSMFEDGVVISSERNEEGKIKTYSLEWNKVNIKDNPVELHNYLKKMEDTENES